MEENRVRIRSLVFKSLLRGLLKIGLLDQHALDGHRVHGRKGIFKSRHLRNLLKKRPVILGIETTNVCNAKCIFCAYSVKQPKKKIMTITLFKKIVEEYAALGGGFLSLTPIVGEALTDPHFFERIEILKNYPEISPVSFHTNGILFNKYSEDKLAFILNNLGDFSMSMGGLDAESHKKMFGVDSFKAVYDGFEKLIKVRNKFNFKNKIYMDFRISIPPDEFLKDSRLDFFRQDGVVIRAGNNYGNWGGIIKELPAGATLNEVPTEFPAPCWTFYLGPEVLADGRVTGCGCMDFECKLEVGNAEKSSLEDIWLGRKYAALRKQFSNNNAPELCKKCSYYSNGELFARTEAMRKYRIGRSPFSVD